jgi:hypothetical protein
MLYGRKAARGPRPRTNGDLKIESAHGVCALAAEEYLASPAGRHHDQIDAVSQSLIWQTQKESSIFECDWGRSDVGAPHPDDILRFLRRSYKFEQGSGKHFQNRLSGQSSSNQSAGEYCRSNVGTD